MTDLPKDPFARSLLKSLQGGTPRELPPLLEPKGPPIQLGKAKLLYGMGGYEPAKPKE